MNLFGNQDPQNLFGDLLAQFGYSMLAGKGNLGQNIGNAGLSNMQYRQQQEQLAKERERQAMQDQMLKLQVGQFQEDATAKNSERQRQQQLRALQGGFAMPGQPAQMLDPRQQEGGQQSIPGSPGGFDMRGYSQAAQQRGLMSPMEAAQLTQKSYTKLGKGEALFDESSMKPVFTNADKEDESPLAKLVRESQKFAPGTATRKYYDDAISKATTHQPGTNVSVSTATKPFLNELGKGAGESVIADFNAAKSAVGTLQNVRQMRDALKGSVAAGPGANAQVLLTQVGQKLGVGGNDSAEMLQNTRALVQGLARQELAAAAGMKGQGQITESERGILKRAESGDIDSMTVPELNTLFNALEKTARFKIGAHNSTLKRLQGDPNSADIVRHLTLPEYEAPQPQGPAPIRFDKNGKRLS